MAQRDLHVYSTLCIAKVADYSDDAAVLLAWACGETDHTLQVKLWNCLWSNLGLYFHFWPSDKKDLICRVDSELSRRIIEQAPQMAVEEIGEWSSLWSKHICRIGIALHGLQDTYFHREWVGGFSRHNVLPAWAHDRLTLSLPFPYGHSPMGKEPDIANATWYDPRSNETIINRHRVFDAITATGEVLGITSPPEIYQIFADVKDYELCKQKLRDLAGMPNLKFSNIRGDMMKKYGLQFKEAAKAQTEIVKTYLKEE